MAASTLSSYPQVGFTLTPDWLLASLATSLAAPPAFCCGHGPLLMLPNRCGPWRSQQHIFAQCLSTVPCSNLLHALPPHETLCEGRDQGLAHLASRLHQSTCAPTLQAALSAP